MDFIIAKEEDTLCISDPVDKFYISDHSFAHSEIRVNKTQAVRRHIRMRSVEEEIKKELEEIGDMNKGESHIDKAVGMYNDKVKVFSTEFVQRYRKGQQLDIM